MKALYVEFRDRNGVFRLALPATPGKLKTDNVIPPGVIIGKGWTVSTSFREVELCECGEPVHAGPC